MALRLISAFWAQKHLILYFLDMMYVVFLKNFLLDLIRASYWLLHSFWPPGRKNI